MTKAKYQTICQMTVVPRETAAVSLIVSAPCVCRLYEVDLVSSRWIWKQTTTDCCQTKNTQLCNMLV